MTPTEWFISEDPEAMLGIVLPSASNRKRRLFAVACCRQLENWLLGTAFFRPYKDGYGRAIETSERFADGKATSAELSKALWAADCLAFRSDQAWDVTIEELRKANFGDDTEWPDRLMRRLTEDERQEMEAYRDPAAWLASNANNQNFDLILPIDIDPLHDVADEDCVLIGETISRKVLLVMRHFGSRGRETKGRAVQASLIRDIFGDPFSPPKLDLAWRTPDVIDLGASIYEDRKFDHMPSLADAIEESGCENPSILGHCRGTEHHVRGCWVLDLILGNE